MADAMAGLSLACNIMQVISFSLEVVGIARRAFRGASIDDNLVERTQRLNTLSISLTNSLNRFKVTKPSSTGLQTLQDIAQGCRNSLLELSGELSQLGATTRKRGLLQAVRVTARSIIKKGKIEKLETNMMQWQQMMDSGLLLEIWSSSEAQELLRQANFEGLDTDLRNIITQLARGKDQLTSQIHTEAATVKLQLTTDIARSEMEIKEQIGRYTTETQARFTKDLSDFQATNSALATREQLLASLRFGGMRERENMIRDPSTNTFDWIFSPGQHTCSGFAEWLQSEARTYWITGKPGSGKSTLMKFITRDPRTRRLLKPNTLILSHYFWSPGHLKQKSIRGLLCGVLLQLLKSNSELVNTICSGLDNTVTTVAADDWPIPILKDCVLEALRRCSQPICLFVDGLDEISTCDGPHNLKDLIEDLTKATGVKACLASRPEAVFENVYGSGPKLRMQDLTAEDIRKFCAESIESFKKDTPASWRYQQNEFAVPGKTWEKALVNTLVEKAEGVFLWIHLVLKSIHRGLSNQDSMDMIYQRVRNLPKGLDELYQSMWTRATIDREIYGQTAALYLHLLLESEKYYGLFEGKGLSIMGLTAATSPSTESLLALVPELGLKLMLSEIRHDCESLAETIGTRCGGLIEIQSQEEFDKQILHGRTDLEDSDSLSSDGYSPRAGTKIEFLSDEELRAYGYGPNSYPSTSNCLGGEYTDLLPFTHLKIKFIHRTALDFLTSTEQGKAILGMDKTCPEDRQRMLLLATISESALWTKTEDGENFDYYIQLMAAIQYSSIKKLEKQRLLHIAEFLRPQIIKAMGSDCEMDFSLLTDFTCSSASWGLPSYAMSTLKQSKRRKPKELCQQFKDRLLQCSAGYFTTEQAGTPLHVSLVGDLWQIWTEQLQLVQHLISLGARPNQLDYFEPQGRRETGRGRLTTPILSIVWGIIFVFIQGKPKPGPPSKLALQICDTLELALRYGTRLEGMAPVALDIYSSGVHFFKPEGSYYPILDPSESYPTKFIVCKATTSFFVRLLLDLLPTWIPDLKLNQEFIWSRATIKKRLSRASTDNTMVKLIVFRDSIKKYAKVPESTAYLDPDVFRAGIRRILKHDWSKGYDMLEDSDDLFNMINKTAGPTRSVKSEAQLEMMLRPREREYSIESEGLIGSEDDSIAGQDIRRTQSH